MEWIKFTDKKPKIGLIIYINYKKENESEWAGGFSFYRGGQFEDPNVEINGYWVYTDGLSINIPYPESA